MPNEMKAAIIASIITATVSLITTIINAILQIIRDKNANVEERRMKVIEYKIQAYRELYSMLIEYKKYFCLFVESGNEFKISEENSRFAPLEQNTKFRELYNRNILYFSNALRCKIESVLEDGEALNNLAIVLCGDDADDVFGNCLEESCKRIIFKVDICIKFMKKELKID